MYKLLWYLFVDSLEGSVTWETGMVENGSDKSKQVMSAY